MANQILEETSTVPNQALSIVSTGVKSNRASISLKDEEPVKIPEPPHKIVPSYTPKPKQIALAVLACNRVGVFKSLESIFKYKPLDQFAVIVSQDCNHLETEQEIKKFSDRILYLKQPVQETPKLRKGHEEYGAYYRIARHYKWVMTQVFDVLLFEQLIILEDDMIIAPDFFDYFEAFLPLLKSDPKLMCISAWNDNGKSDRVEDSAAFYRTDFFPGLGWMLIKELWLELKPKWPDTFWDDWLRGTENRKGRHCIRPEVSRTFNFGREGSSGGLYFEQHIAKMTLSSAKIKYVGYDRTFSTLLPYSEALLNYEHGPEVVDVRNFIEKDYNDRFIHQVYKLSTFVNAEKLKSLAAKPVEELQQNLLITNNQNTLAADQYFQDTGISPFEDSSSDYYCGPRCRRRFTITYGHAPHEKGSEFGQIVEILKRMNLMPDIREDAPRMAYKGIVPFKMELSHPLPLSYSSSNQTENFFMVYIAPKFDLLHK